MIRKATPPDQTNVMLMSQSCEMICAMASKSPTLLAT